MKILLSPAKMMNLETNSKWEKRTTPEFIKYSKQLQSVLKEFSPSELENLLDISPKLSMENWERNQKWKSAPSNQESIQAILAFKGEVYKGLNAENLSNYALEYLENNLIILSGLYGMLRPSDVIMPYRLEMGKKLKTENAENLYEFWRNILTQKFNNSLQKEEPILNLASKEYFKVLNSKEITNPILEVEFKDYKNGILKSIMMYFKHARGNMARWCAENNITDIDTLKTYNEDKYEFSEEHSNKNVLVFVR